MIVDPPYNQSEPPLLSLERITKKFGAVNALDDVSFTLRRGEIHALLGENGAGKTTLMRIAFGLIQPDSGTIAIESRRVRLASPADAIAAGLGMVHQQFSLVPAMTVAENIALGGRGRLVMKRLLERIEYVMTQTGLDLDPSATVASLGPAERQKLEILRTFAHDARVLILDEPTAVLTGPDTAELFAQIRRYTGAGNSVVLITHKLSDALKHAGFVTVLRKGRVVLESAASEQDELTLGAAMIGESLVEAAAPRNKGRLKTSQPLARIDSVEIHRGEIVGIAALEGAAKPYLASLIQRRRTPGTRITVGFVPENRKDDALIEDFSLVQNYALSNAGSLSGVLDWSELERSAEKVVRLFDVRTTGVEASPKQLSGGNQQRFVIGRELTRKPDLLVLENPTQGLDLKAAASVHMHLRNAAKAGAAVVFYSSDLDELAMYSDRVIVASGTGITPVPLNRDAIGHALLAIQ